jgi:hypothetical protein
MAESNCIATKGDYHEGKGKDVMGDHEEEGELNTGRHKHKLCLSETLPAYTCSGCKEKGKTIGYRCKSCKDLILHKVCAELPDSYDHPFLQCLQFRSKTRLSHHCNACQKLLGGYVFESQKHDIRLHPLCVTLPQTLKFTGHAAHELKLLAHDKGRPYACVACDKRFESGGWRYRCTPCNISVDLSCVKTEFHKLPEYDADSGGGSTLRRAADIGSSLSSKLNSAAELSAGLLGSMALISSLFLTGENDDAVTGDNDDADNGYNDDAVTGDNDDAINGYNEDAVTGNKDDADNGYNDDAVTGDNGDADIGYNDNAVTGDNDDADNGYNDDAVTGYNENADIGYNDDADTGDNDDADNGGF